MTTTRYLLIPGPQDATVCDGCRNMLCMAWSKNQRHPACLAAERAAREKADELARLRARVEELEAERDALKTRVAELVNAGHTWRVPEWAVNGGHAGDGEVEI